MIAIKPADSLENEFQTASGRRLNFAGDNQGSFGGEAGRTSAMVRRDELRNDVPASSKNAAESALEQSLHALMHQRDCANRELETMLKRRELVLCQIDKCSREISEIIQAIRKLRTLD